MNELLAKLGLRFSDDLKEQQFVAFFCTSKKRMVQYAMVLGAFLVYVFFIWDAIIDQSHSDITHAMRGFVLSPTILLCAALLNFSRMDRYFEFLAIVPATLTSFGLSTIYAVLQHGFNYGAIGIVLVVMFTFILLVVRFSYYLVFAMLALAVFDGLQILSSNASDGMLIVNNMSLGTAIILGLFSAWNRETTLRREFDTALELGAARKEVSKLELSNQALRAAARRASEGAQAHLVVSYRRSDTATVTGRIVDRLIFIFGEKSVFVDIDNIPLGVDFRAHIVAAIRNADALVAVIGPNWTGKDASGHGRIDDEDDPVRVEVETALQLNLSVIPILVEGARMPEAQELPSCIRELCYKNALEVSSGRDFHRHLDLVMDAVINALGRRRGQIEQARNIDDGAGLRQSGVGSV